MLDIAQHELKKKENLKPTEAAIRTAREVYDKINEPFQKIFKVSFNHALTKVPLLNLSINQTSGQNKKVPGQQAMLQKT